MGASRLYGLVGLLVGASLLLLFMPSTPLLTLPQ